MLECEADREKFGIYRFSKGKDWRTARDELLDEQTNALCLGQNDKNEHILRKMQNKRKIQRNNK